MKHILWPGLLLASTITAQAQAWFTADCQVQNGEKIYLAVSQGQARISYNNDPPQTAFPEYENNMMSVVHISARANLVMSIDVRTGRAYVIVVTDKGRGSDMEYNAYCKVNMGKK